MHATQRLAPVLALVVSLVVALACVSRPSIWYESTDATNQGFYNDYEQCLKITQKAVETEHRGFVWPITPEKRTELRAALRTVLLECLESRGWLVHFPD